MKIIFLKERHALPESLSKYLTTADKEKISFSQFLVGQQIKKYLYYPIVQEGLPENVSTALVDPGFDETSLRLIGIFPQGYPTDFASLNGEQKNSLYEHGAVSILMHLRELSVVYKGMREQTVYEAGVAVRKVILARNDLDFATKAANQHLNHPEDATVIVIVGNSFVFTGHHIYLGYELIDTTNPLSFRSMSLLSDVTSQVDLSCSFFSSDSPVENDLLMSPEEFTTRNNF